MLKRMMMMAVLAAILGLAVGTAQADVFYVRGDGLGDDGFDGLSWSTAWSSLDYALNSVSYDTPTTVNVQASTPGQAYDVAQRTTTGRPAELYVDFEGGWTDIDTAPAQTSRSLVSDLSGTASQAGFTLTGNNHDQPKEIGINRFDFADVTSAVNIQHPGSLNSSPITLTLTNSSIEAQNDGIRLDHSASGFTRYARLIADNVVISAGLGGPGDGIYIAGQPDGTVIENADITSADGKGVHFRVYGHSANWGPGHEVVIRDTVVHGSASDGIWHGDINENPHYNTPGALTLERVALFENSGHGLYVLRRQGSGGQPMNVDLTNTLIARNEGSGVWLEGDDGGNNAQLVLSVLNSTIADNDDTALYLWAYQPNNNSATVLNSIIAGVGDGLLVHDTSADGPVINEEYNNFFVMGNELVRIGDDGTTYPVLDITDLVSDPLFSGLLGEEYRLLGASPAIDAANPDYAPLVDILGALRPLGLGPDMGAYEGGVAAPIAEPAGLSLLGMALLGLKRKRRN